MANTINQTPNKTLNQALEIKPAFEPLPTPNFSFALASGKRKQIIDLELYSPITLVGNKNLVNSIPPIKDLVRARSGKFWSLGSSLPQMGLTPSNKIAFSVAAKDKPADIESDAIFGDTTQTFILKANKELFKLNPGTPPIASTIFNKNLWRIFVTDIPPVPPAAPLPPITELKTANTKFILDKLPSLQVISRDNLQLAAGQKLFFNTTEQSIAQLATVSSQQRTANTIDEIVTSRGATLISPRSIQQNNITKALAGNPVFASQQSSIQFNQNVEQARVLRSNLDLSVTRIAAPTISIVAKKQSTPATFGDIIPTIRENVDYFDHVFDLNIPFSKKEIDGVGSPIGSLFVDIKPNYNFLVSNYESVISSQNARETLLPNMYAFLSEYHHRPQAKEKPTIFKQHITLAGNIPDVFVDVTNNQGEKIFEKDTGEYFDKFAHAFGDLIRLDTPIQDLLNKKFTNLVAPVSNIDLFKDFNDKKNLFPMYFDISFSTDNFTQFAQILEDSQLSSFLVKDIIEGNILPELKPFQESLAATIEKTPKRLSNRTISSDPKTLRTWDMTLWLQKISSNPINEFEGLNSGVFLGSLSDEIKMTSNSQYEFIKNLLIIIFAGKVKQLVKDNFRSYEDILNGKPAYSENVLYRIEKSDTATGNVLQNFYLPNTRIVDIMRFVDTQVKYNKQYTYKIFVYQMVLGNQYQYKFGSVTDDNAEFSVINRPSIKLVETLFFEFTGRIMDNPPVSPDINIIPYRAVNNQILFNLNSNVGQYKMLPILLEPGDAALIKQLREAQQVSEKGFLQFSGNDRAKAFEIFRVDKLPKSYQDFAGKRIALVATDLPLFSIQATTAASFIDNILPNKKYYYTFRAIDSHGHISNPTSVFELELVDDDGTIYPLINVVQFDTNEDLKAHAKTAKKFIQLVPSFNQAILNEEKSGLVEQGKRVDSVKDKVNFHLGVADESIWGKNFKVRLTSKRTGKKIDFNVQFIHSFVKRVD